MASLDPTTAERLVQLRLLHQRAVSAAADSTSAGQHGAIIALDGVCEQALLLAAAHLSLEIKKDGVLDVHTVVAGALGTKWSREGGKAVRELHRSRNNAQHHGVVPAPEFLPRWLSEIDRYIGTLVWAAFGVVLDDVRIASAVADEAIRGKLFDAEEALSQGALGSAVQTAAAAHAAARAEFRRHRGASRFGAPVRVGFREIDDLASALRAVDAFIDVAHFAADPSDALWLDALVASVRHRRYEPSLLEAQRALSFVLSWVLRWEAYEARRPEAWEAGPSEPSFDQTYTRPFVADIKLLPAKAPGGGMEYLVDLREVPPGWLHEVTNAQQALRERRNAVGLGYVQGREPDQLTLVVDDGLQAADVRRLLDAILDEAHRLYTGLLTARREARDNAATTAAAYREVLEPLTAGLVLDVAPVVEEVGSFGGGATPVKLKLAEPAARLDPRELTAEFARTAAEEAPEARLGWDSEPGCFQVDAARTPADRVESWLASAVAAVAERQAHAESERELEDARRAALEQRVREAVLGPTTLE